MAIRILVVDDSLVERVLVEGLLRKNPDYQIRLAANGQEALAAIAAQPPDLVLTDLVMPQMDGLELVRATRSRFPTIPVILMTAFGDEATAFEALEAGAASYVPKAQKAERLMSAVERVADYAVANRDRERLLHRTIEYHCRFSIENDRRMIRALIAEIQRAMVGVEFGDTVERIRVGEALEEALLNAMYHGNLEIGKQELSEIRSELDDRMLDRLVEQRCRDRRIFQRRILVVTNITKDEVRFVVRDEGRGFNTGFATSEPTSDRFASGQNRGMILIRSLMDEVKFNRAGNELVMQKRASQSFPGKNESSKTSDLVGSENPPPP
jgi:CheY-like chemotaxis protein/anti-sigma regulatory factor (Ser/Thr protein kinase)